MEPIVIWDLDDDPEGNVVHLAEHGITDASASSGRPITFGWTSTGKHLAVVWEDAGDDPRMVYPVTAYETPPRAG
jgi:hypothetical protein